MIEEWVAVSYWVPNVGGTLEQWLRYTLSERRAIVRKIRDITKALRGGGTTVTGHHVTDRKL